jgi:opacity protein-like surface antigen
MKKLIMLFSFILFSSLVSADIGDNFLSIKLGSSDSDNTGISTLTDQTGDSAQTSDNDLGDSDILGIGVGKYFSESFSGEISLSQRKGFKYNTTVSDATQKYTADVESLAVFLNGYFNSQSMSIFQTSVTPYFGAGVGISRNKMSSVDLITISDGDVFGKASGNTETEFAFKLSLGTMIGITEKVSMDINYQYVDLGKIKSGTGLTHDSRDMVAPFSGPEITSSEFNVGLQIVF